MKGIIMVILLTGCATMQTEPLTLEHVRFVDRPLPVPCAKEADIPPLPQSPIIANDADIEQQAAWAGIRVKQLREYVVKLRIALLTCTKGKP